MLRRPSSRTFASIAVLVAFSLTAAPSFGQAGSNAAAQALFDQAKSLMAAGKASEACPKLEESQKLDPGSGTLINLALCYEKTGRTASAWSTYRDAAAAARVAGNADRERGARERAAALAPKVSKLTVEVPEKSRLSGLTVTRDGVEVGPAQWGMPIPTDEGAHELVAKAPGYQDFRVKVAVGAQGATASVSVPMLVAATEPAAPTPFSPVATPAPGAASAAAQPAPAKTGPAPAAPPERSSGGLGGQRIGAIVVTGVGVAGIAVGTIFGLKAISKKDRVDQSCDGTECSDDTGVSAGKDGYSAANISTIGMIVGAAGLAGGAVLWLTAPKRAESTEVGLGPTGFVVRRAF